MTLAVNASKSHGGEADTPPGYGRVVCYGHMPMLLSFSQTHIPSHDSPRTYDL